MRSYILVIAANGSAVLDVAGNFFKLVAFSGSSGALTVRADSQSRDSVDASFLTVRVGDKPRFNGTFDKLSFFNSDAAQVQVEIIAGLGDHDQDSLVGNVTVSGIVSTAGSTNDSPAAYLIGAGTSLDLPADSTIRERIFTAYELNAAEVYVRDQTGTTSVGVPIGGAYGRTFVWNNNGAIRVRNNNGTAHSVFVLNNRT